MQSALRHVLEPIFEREFAEHSYGFLERGYRWPRKKSLRQLKDQIRHKTKRRGKKPEGHH
ncbi:hypothetical protein WDW89_25030 [Deltaproteobacteria bacterium TL4]